MNGNSRVLLVGAGGYLGSVVTPLLLEQGYEVIAFDRYYFGAEVLASVARHPRLRIVKGDIRSLDPTLMDGVGAVVHLAALSNDPACEIDAEWTIQVNRDAAIEVARLSKQHGVDRFLFASSCSVYGAGGDNFLTEDSPLKPVSAYARAKVEAEREILLLGSPSFHPVALRKATLFGISPRMRFDLSVNTMTMHAITRRQITLSGGGQQWRPFLHVRDAANAYLACLKAPVERITGRCFNVVASNLRISKLAELVSQRTGNAEIHCAAENPDKRDYRVSASLFERTLGFESRVSVEEGIEEIATALRRGRYFDLDNSRYYTLRRLQEVLHAPAMAGGESVRRNFLPLALPLLGKAEEDEVIDTLRSGWITTGPKTQRFEAMCREYLGSKHAIAVNSCTAALQLALASSGIGRGDEVITTPISWPATSSVVIHQGAMPVFVDVEPDTLNIDASKIEAAITPRTRAILPVHMAGQPSDLDRLRAIADRHGLILIEDAAHAIGAEYGGKKIGTISEATAFSFYPIKNITTIEGGLLTTDDDDLAERAKMLSNQGISRDAWKRYSAEGSLHWQLLAAGFKMNMTDVQASLGIHQLPRLEEFIRVREQYVAMYREAFSDLPAIQTLAERSGIRHAHHLFIVLLQLDQLSIDRDHFMLALKAENIGTGTHFVSMHLQPFYRKEFGIQPEDFPVARQVSEQLVSLPLYPKMTASDVEDVIKAVRKVAKAYGVRSKSTRQEAAEPVAA
jgi:dTDP-4-amino-4,6-dideoxygalactose transaminase/nucleoside-diphosphate-sugar epimerase